MKDKVSLYFHTIRYLKVKQIAARVLKKFKRRNFVVKGNKKIENMLYLFVENLDENEAYLARFDTDKLMQNEIELLHESHVLDFKNWDIGDTTTHLWLFNLQYMEYLIPLAVKYKNTKDIKYYEKIREFITSWYGCFSRISGDAWAPYVISLRLPNWLIVMQLIEDELNKDEEFCTLIVNSVYTQYYYLKSHTEDHLLGNHYLENLKTLYICSVLFGESEEEKKYRVLLTKELKEEILSDGMHFELSFMYHKIIAEGLLRVILTMKQAGKQSEEELKFYIETFQKMCDIEASFEKGNSRTLLFNDSGDNVAKTADALLAAAINMKVLSDVKSNIDVLPKAGYYQYLMNDVRVFVDGGSIGPDYMPGHGHCDCFSYELFRKGEPIIVNSGTFQYQDAKRVYFRSTKAHNTFTINDTEQSQCWSEHRVAKRIRNIEVQKSENDFIGKGSYWNGQKVQRGINVVSNGMMVLDECLSTGDVKITSYIHINPKYDLQYVDGKTFMVNCEDDETVTINVINGDVSVIQRDENLYFYAPEFGQIEQMDTIEIVSKKGSKVQYKVTWKE